MHEMDVRKPEEWRAPDLTQSTVHAVFVAAIYDGIARAARDWLVTFLKTRAPANLGAPLATLPRAQEILGGIEARLAVNATLDRQLCLAISMAACRSAQSSPTSSS